MKNKILYISLIALGSLSIAGCKKYLEQAPDLRATLDSPSKVSELLVTAYPHANYITFCEALSDNADDKGLAAGGGDAVNRDPWRFDDVQSRDIDSPDSYWNACYKAIAATNQALKAINLAPNPNEYSMQKGEALVARAYSHFMLVTLFSKVYDVNTAATDPGIPYVTEPEDIVFKKYERKTVAYVYQQIENDLNQGLPLIKDSGYKIPKYHFTTSAAHAFAARFFLFKKDYAKVIEHANLVFAGGNILPNLRDYVASNSRSMEYATRQAYYTAASNPANILLAEANSVWGRSYPSYRYSLTFNLVYKTIWGANVAGGTWAYQLYGRDLSLNIPKFPEHFVLTSQNGNIGDPYNMIPLFSAEEVLFNRAEANAYLGNTAAALKDLNDYGSKRLIISDANPVYSATTHAITEAKINSYYKPFSIQEGIVKTILDFKRIDFMFEGQRWFDILRYNLPVVHATADLKSTYTLGPNDPRRVLQIPAEAELAGLERNPR
ncbi:RagB/SusD family nutrient uptake outer membrane protein [Pedobacter sp. WC2501]|uniref:RagB/SusD family nutrient uptake outer membrane protein n=1 Tax=Pedobacter sp. WC2501 TaxID=3461400 RepID=UPI004046621E